MRFLVLVFLFLLPLQLPAAAAANPCQHAQERTAPSLEPSGNDTAAMVQALGLELDCGACHGSCAWVPTGTLHPMPQARREVLHTGQALTLDGPRAHRPERPQWAAPVEPGSGAPHAPFA